MLSNLQVRSKTGLIAPLPTGQRERAGGLGWGAAFLGGGAAGGGFSAIFWRNVRRPFDIAASKCAQRAHRAA